MMARRVELGRGEKGCRRRDARKLPDVFSRKAILACEICPLPQMPPERLQTEWSRNPLFYKQPKPQPGPHLQQLASIAQADKVC
jgi:hypothetical protein